jgi:hypothetical protein
VVDMERRTVVVIGGGAFSSFSRNQQGVTVFTKRSKGRGFGHPQ